MIAGRRVENLRSESEVGHQYLQVPLNTLRRLLMTGNKAISKLLKLKGLRLRNVVFKSREKAVYLLVKPYKNGCLCPECESRGKIKRIMPQMRTWRDVNVCGWTIYPRIAPELRPQNCGHRTPVRPGNAGLVERRWRYLWKMSLSSSGCETRPTKAEPGRSVVSLAP